MRKIMFAVVVGIVLGAVAFANATATEDHPVLPPTRTPAPMPSIPATLTVAEIEAARRASDRQAWEAWRRAAIGKEIRFSGPVIDTYEGVHEVNAQIQIDDGNGIATVVIVDGVHYTEIDRFQDGDYVTGTGRVTKIGTVFGSCRVVIDYDVIVGN